jgi:hypothetical protein
VRPPDVLERERPRELVGQADLLVDLDHPAGAHDPEVWTVGAHPRLGLRGIRVDHEHGVARANRRLLARSEGVAQAVADDIPALAGSAGEERELAPAARHRVTVDGDAGRIRAAARHLDEHRGEMLPESLLDLRRLREQADDPTHVFRRYTRGCAITLETPATWDQRLWRFSPYR